MPSNPRRQVLADQEAEPVVFYLVHPFRAGRLPDRPCGAAGLNEPGVAPGGFLSCTRYHNDEQICHDPTEASRFFTKVWFQMPKFIAYAVDLSGVALARYDLAAIEKESAEREAEHYLDEYPVIEVWSHERVARLVRE